ncbi:hypothetical protein V8F20_008637 [Naviculisporaceae sp. PSN 640]
MGKQKQEVDERIDQASGQVYHLTDRTNEMFQHERRAIKRVWEFLIGSADRPRSGPTGVIAERLHLGLPDLYVRSHPAWLWLPNGPIDVAGFCLTGPWLLEAPSVPAFRARPPPPTPSTERMTRSQAHTTWTYEKLQILPDVSCLQRDHRQSALIIRENTGLKRLSSKASRSTSNWIKMRTWTIGEIRPMMPWNSCSGNAKGQTKAVTEISRCFYMLLESSPSPKVPTS